MEFNYTRCKCPVDRGLITFKLDAYVFTQYKKRVGIGTLINTARIKDKSKVR